VRLFFLLFIFFSPSLWAQLTIEKKIEKKILAEQQEAKTILLQDAIISVLPELSKELEIDLKSFNEMIEEKFKFYFQSFKDRKLTEKFGKNFATELTDDQKNEFTRGLDSQREVELRRFTRYESILDNYSFKSLSKDEAQVWSATVILSINKGKFQKLKDRIFSNDLKLFNKLYLVAEINPIHMTWKDLSLETEEQFSNPIVQSWVKWLSNKSIHNVDQVVECTERCLSDFYNWVEVSQDEGMKISEDHLNNLWLKFSFNVRKITFRPNIDEWELEWDGSAVILDANTKLIIGAYTIPLERKVWRGLDQKELNSELASSIYRSGLDPLNKSIKKIQDSERFNRVRRLVIKGHQRLGDVIQLTEMLKKMGEKIHLELRLDFFGLEEAHLLCFYQGEEKSFTDVLSQLKELKSSHRYKLLNDSTGVHHLIRFVTE
jgi:hypothetical protein